MSVDKGVIEALRAELDADVRERIGKAVAAIVAAKQKGGKVVVVTGSGPNLHEGVTTLLAELIRTGIVDGVTTSSAAIAHEMAGTLERVHRVRGEPLGLDAAALPMDGMFEISLLPDGWLETIEAEMPVERDLMDRALATEGANIIKAAGNLAYPLGLRTERLAREAEALAKSVGDPLEAIAGAGADSHTMIGAGYARGAPVLVSIPQLVGGGAVGLAVGDSISITARAARVAALLGEADVIIESAVALTQEIHDGPFETHTGHGIWADWDGFATYSLAGKQLIRIDLDPNLERAWQMERDSGTVAAAVAKGLPKTKVTGVPFRMEMSGFARLPTSLPVIGDIGVIWPLVAYDAAQALGVELGFMSYPQQTEAGREMREWIVENVHPVHRAAMHEAVQKRRLQRSRAGS
ncbi:MAG: hypothetical protein JSV65_02990 [Armatimonadota bacterium]|nr:MAG: hypothetical protein JSV65_02990 [Armatimonadota bacterium]